jgi:hypothetical protein
MSGRKSALLGVRKRLRRLDAKKPAVPALIIGGKMNAMKYKVFFSRFAVVLFVLTLASPSIMADREAQQAELDAACELAREEKLAPLRQQYIEECVEKEQRPDRASCERFYADYGAQSGNRAPLFYDLPECVEAFDFQRSDRRRGG